MLTDENRKEMMSRAYVYAVAAKAGVNLSKPEYDVGVDGEFHATEYNSKTRRYETKNNSTISYQLKATTRAKFEDGFIKYVLEAKNYDALVDESLAPDILILYVMPREEEQWLSISQEKTILRQCAWWYSLKGLPDKPNKAGVTIYIPVDQVFTPETLIELFNRVKRGEEDL